jgi:hypothetical protein
VQASSPATSRPRLAPRLRPGERPAWWDASADRHTFDRWRAAADAAGLAIDAWAALLLELDLVLDDLASLPDPERFLERALAAEDGVGRLGPPGSLRSWLAGELKPDEIDELPELVLPERLVVRLTPGAPLAPHLRSERIEFARACDRRAALHGRTLESWALRVALHEG